MSRSGAQASWAAAALLLIGVCGWLYAAIPPSPDQAQLDYLGWQVLGGAAPYADFVDMNWPGAFWMHALSTGLFGHTLHAWRTFDFILMLLCTAALADLLRRTCGVEAAVWAVLLYPFLYGTLGGSWFAGQRDLVAGHLLFVALWCHVRAWSSGRGASAAVAMGLALAAASLVKPTFALLAPLLVLHGGWIAAGRRAGWRPPMTYAVVAGSATAAGLGIGLGVLLWQGSDLGDVFQTILVLHGPGFRIDVKSGTEILALAGPRFLEWWHWITAGALASATWMAVRRPAPALEGGVPFVLLFAAGAASYWIQRKGYSYHMGVCVQAMLGLLFAGLGALTAWARRTPDPARRALAAALLLLPVVGTAVKLRNTYELALRWRLGQVEDAIYYTGFSAGNDLTVADTLALADEVDATVPRDAAVLTWGHAPLVNFLTRRPQPTRFHYHHVLDRAHPGTPVEDKWNTWFRDDLAKTPPELCIVQRRELAQRPDWPLEGRRHLSELLGRSYEIVSTVGESDVYRRRPAAGQPAPAEGGIGQGTPSNNPRRGSSK